jgi:hypothetical protein
MSGNRRNAGLRTVYRCDWCGRFYSSSLPEGSACPNHIPEHNARLAASIARHNARLEERRADDEYFRSGTRYPGQ